jgi:uncharacterized protein (TIGR03084 family)
MDGGPDFKSYTSKMDDVMKALREQLLQLQSIVTGLGEDQLAWPSACADWSISDVLLHLAQTNEMATASARGQLAGDAGGWTGSNRKVRTDVDDLAARAVEGERGASGVEVRTRWVKSSHEMLDALQACDPATRVVWVAGEMAPRTLATTRLAETWIHTGDVCVGLDIAPPRSDRIWHIARLVHRTLPYSFLRSGIEATGGVRFELTSATDDSDVRIFGADDAPTLIAGAAVDLCRVAGQRADATETSLCGTGPDAPAVLRIMRTFA